MIALFRCAGRGPAGPALVALLGLVLVSAEAAAQQRNAGYETVLLWKGEPVDPDLRQFTEVAGEALGRFARGFGEHRPPVPVDEIFTDKVTVFVGGMKLTPEDRFERLGRFPRSEFLAFLGQFLDDEPIRRIGAEARGARFLAGLDADDFVAANDRLDGQTCTGSFERLADDRIRALLAETDTTIEAWRVATISGREAGRMRGGLPLDWSVGQLLYVDADAPPIRSCCWDFVVMPDGSGAYVQMMGGPTVLVPYLGHHVCFTRTGEGWRVSAVAIRM